MISACVWDRMLVFRCCGFKEASSGYKCGIQAIPGLIFGIGYRDMPQNIFIRTPIHRKLYISFLSNSSTHAIVRKAQDLILFRRVIVKSLRRGGKWIVGIHGWIY